MSIIASSRMELLEFEKNYEDIIGKYIQEEEGGSQSFKINEHSQEKINPLTDCVMANLDMKQRKGEAFSANQNLSFNFDLKDGQTTTIDCEIDYVNQYMKVDAYNFNNESQQWGLEQNVSLEKFEDLIYEKEPGDKLVMVIDNNKQYDISEDVEVLKSRIEQDLLTKVEERYHLDSSSKINKNISREDIHNFIEETDCKLEDKVSLDENFIGKYREDIDGNLFYSEEAINDAEQNLANQISDELSYEEEEMEI